MKMIIDQILGQNPNQNELIAIKGISLVNIPIALKKQFVDSDYWNNSNQLTKDLFSSKAKLDLLNYLILEKPVREFISYEALIEGFRVAKEIGVNRQIRILDLAAGNYFPNNFNFEIEDTELAAETGVQLEQSNWMSVCANSKTINDAIYVQYKDEELLKHVRANGSYVDVLQDEFDLSSFSVNENEMPGKDHIVFGLDSDGYNEQIDHLFRSEKQECDILLSKKGLVEEQNKALQRLCNLLSKSGISFSFYFQKAISTYIPRPELGSLLKNHWNSDSFRSIKIYTDPDISKNIEEISQAEVVETIIRQYELGNFENKTIKDIILTAPTGAGKSLLFQMPAMYLGQKFQALSIIVTPLKALMLDQVEQLKNQKDYHKVAFINSDISLVDREKILESIERNEIDILYLAPELLLSYDISHFLRGRKLGVYVVDEAHTVTTWGRDFRVDYWYLGTHIHKLRTYGKDAEGNKYKFPVVAVTATAPYGGIHDVVFETAKSLKMLDYISYIGYVKRDDIIFDIQNAETITGNLETEKVNIALSRITGFINDKKKCIVYCPYSRHVANIHRRAQQQGLQTWRYFGNLDRDEKNEAYEAFKNAEYGVMIATKAFGMGIDISDIDQVYHLAPTGLLSDYIQEAGRLARRDDIIGTASLDYSTRDFQFINALHGLSRTHNWQLREVMRRLSRIYHDTKRQNMLLNPDEFSHIFTRSNEGQLHNEVKNALMLLEMDLKAKYSQIPVIIARPKNLFSKVYASIDPKDFNKFKRAINSDCYSIINYEQPNNIERIHLLLDLDTIWERKYSDQSFGVIKHGFFSQELFDDFDVKPKLKFELAIDKSKTDTLRVLNAHLANISRAFSAMKGFFTSTEYAIALSRATNNPREAKRISEYILPLFSQRATRPNDILKPNDVRTQANFLQSRRIQNEIKYRLVGNSLNQLVSTIRRTLSTALQENETRFTKYLCLKSGYLHRYTKIGQLIEILSLGSYSLSGGEQPKIFVRINDPFRLSSEAFSNYENAILDDIRTRHERGVDLMREFFGENLSNEERWDFIQDYFLGYKQ